MDWLLCIATGIRVIGWALVHFIWQACLVGLLYSAIKAALPRGEARYRLGMLTLAALAFCPVVTVWHLLQVVTPALAATAEAATANVASTAADDGATNARWMPDAIVNALLPWLVLAWLVGVSGLSVRAWRQWRKIRVLVDTASASASWQARIDAMAQRFGVTRRISVLCSGMVSTPVLVGWIKPVILLPMAVVCHFPVAQIELILAHELAHIRRWDPLANLFQVVLETLHFYHPVVHWISREVRNEREICCDRLALATSGGSRQVLAAALAELGELREQHASLSLAANGGVLLDRVQQLMLPRADADGIASPARLAGALLAAALLLLTIRLEWSDATLQHHLSASLSQWNAGLARARLLVPAASEPLQLRNLVPSRLDALHPQPSPAQVAAVGLADPIALLPVAVQAPGRIGMPQLPAMRVGDLAPQRRESPLRIEIQAAALEVAGAPAPVHIRRPTYPQEALLQGLEGKVTIEYAIGVDGNVHDLKVVAAAASGTFEQAALQAMRGWKYPRGVSQTPRRYRQTLTFTLSGSRTALPASGLIGGAVIEAQVGCQVSIGSNICRSPENFPARGRVDANAAVGEP